MTKIINELKQVFEFEGEISEANIEIDEAQQILTIKNITILKILDINRNKYIFNFYEVSFGFNVIEILQKYNMDKIQFENCIFFEENQELYDENDEINFSIEFLNCKFLHNFSLFGINFKKDISFENSIFGDEERKRSIRFRKVNFTDNVIFKNTKFYGTTKISVCNFEKNVDFSETSFYDELNISACQFKKDKESCLNFTDANFYNRVEISDCKFHNDVNFINLQISQEKNNDFNVFDISLSKFFANLDFTETEFYQEINFNDCQINEIKGLDKTTYYEKVSFEKCNFSEKVNFNESEFKKVFSLEECTFDKDVIFTKANFVNYASFTQTNFKDAVYFDKSEFENFINMANCTINDVMSFYGAKLHYTPYLAGVNIDKNAKFNLMYTDLANKDNIENVVNKYINSSIFKDDKIDIVKGFRESFRILKSYLISNHNLLEASFYRVNELKAKELEMDLQASKLSPSQQIERYLFKIYKCTSNHHNDFLLILNWTITLIIINSIYYYFIEQTIINDKFFLNYDKNPQFLTMLAVSVLIFLLYTFLSVVCEMLAKKIINIIHSFFTVISFIIILIYQPSIITPFIGVFSDNAKNHFLNKSIINLKNYQAISIANRLNPTTFYLNESQAKKDLLANKDIIKKDKNILEKYDNALLKGKNADEIMARINIIYYILMILCLFSLQKTARKNSIIPS